MMFKAMNERQWVTTALFAMGFFVIGLMAWMPDLRKDDLFKVLAQAIVLTAVVNGIVAFHFSANRGQEVGRENAGKAFDAITAVAANVPLAPDPTPPEKAIHEAAQDVANAAQDKADETNPAKAKNDDQSEPETKE